MADDNRVWLDWAESIHGVAPDAGSADTVLRRVLLHETQVRAAAADLPFGAEPSGFQVQLEGPAKGPRR